MTARDVDDPPDQKPDADLDDSFNSAITTGLWGQSKEQEFLFKPKAVKVYLDFLNKISKIQNIIINFLVLLLIALVTYGVFFKNYENILFDDGTDMMCFLDGSTQKIGPNNVRNESATH